MRIDWQLLRFPLIMLIASLLVSVGIIAWLKHYSDQRQLVFENTQGAYRQALQSYDNARRDKNLYRQYLDSFSAYQQEGVIGEEQRLSWIEQLQAINKKLKLGSMHYEISPQSDAALPGLTIRGNISVKVSQMTLSAAVLHEADALTLLDQLGAGAQGYFSIKQCDMISRINRAEKPRYYPGASYIDMDCVLDWYSVEVKS